MTGLGVCLLMRAGPLLPAGGRTAPTALPGWPAMLVDLSAAVEAAAIVLAAQRGYRWDACPAVYDSLEYFHASYREAARGVAQAVLPPLEREVRERVARDIETELAAAIRSNPDQRTRSPRQEMAYKVSAHIARGGACVANPRGVGSGS